MTAPDIAIPDKAAEVLAQFYYERGSSARSWDTLDPRLKASAIHDARAACLAMLKNWPGMYINGWKDVRLPLTQERMNAE